MAAFLANYANQKGECMSQAGDRGVGLFLSPVGQRRIDFQAACGELFGRLFLADGTEQASDLLARQPAGLLVIDLEGFERGIDLAALGGLLARRGGAPAVLVCPFANAGWLPALAAFGPAAYAIGPLVDADWRALVARQLAAPGAGAAPAEAALRALLAVRSRLQQALAGSDDLNRLAGQLCEALCSWPGVVHAALFHLNQMDDLRLVAQQASN